MNRSRAILTSLVVILLTSFPAISWAQNKQISYTLNTQSNRSYRALIQQASFLAEQLIDRAFTHDQQLTTVAVTIIGDRNGQEVPLLTTKVSRANWQEKPQIQSWTQYFSDSAVLLGFTPSHQVHRTLNPYLASKEVVSSHLEPNFYK